MCGIVGVASTEGMKSRSDRISFMKEGLDMDSWRGWDSTGIALITEKDAPVVYKRAINGRDFIQLKQVERYLNDLEKYPVVIGHNRSATVGRGNLVDHNAHPFNYGRITLVHNGHIRNTHSLPGAAAGADCQVDSAQVAFSMNANGEMQTLEQVDGGFTFVWWNAETQLLNIARNSERPLHLAYAAKENTLYWASEFTQILHFMRDIEIDEDIGVLYPSAMHWYQFNLKNLREYKKVPFVKGHGRQYQQSRGQSPGGKTGGQETDSSTKMVYTTPGISDSQELDEIREDISEQRTKDSRISGVPTTRKKIKQAEMKLRRLGLQPNELRVCKPISWTSYKNQEKLGSILAKTNKDGHLVEVLQVTKEEFLKFQDMGHLVANMVNVRTGSNKDYRLIATLSEQMDQLIRNYDNRIACRKQLVELKLGSIDRPYDGPDGTKISEDRFRELAQDGCANCQQPIDIRQHGAVVWVGRPPIPVGPCCNTDDGVMELLGVPDAVRKFC